MNLEQRTRSLLAVVDAFRCQRHDELVPPAQEQARALVRAARSEARQRVHQAVTEARARLASEVAAAQAALETERRLMAQRHAKQKLAMAWSALRPALLARWTQPPSSTKWVGQLIRNALATLPPNHWEIDHAPDWPASEQEEIRRLAREGGATLGRFEPDASIAAGLRIRCGRNVLDATLDGLLEERAALEGKLLKALATAPARND